MDIFLEYIVKRKKSAADIIKIALVFIATLIVLYFSLIMFAIPFIASFALLIDAGIIYLAWLGITSSNIEFEYSVTNGTVDIDKIINKRKRKRVISFKVSESDIIAPVESKEHCQIFNQEYAKVIDASSRRDISTSYFAVVPSENGKAKIIFNPTDKMVEAFKVYAPKKVF